jgi:hypothetical protein
LHIERRWTRGGRRAQANYNRCLGGRHRSGNGNGIALPPYGSLQESSAWYSSLRCAASGAGSILKTALMPDGVCLIPLWHSEDNFRRHESASSRGYVW